MPDKIIEIPNVGRIAFPESMTPDAINAAAAKLYKDANPSHPPPAKEHSWIDTAVDWIPAAGGAIGGLIGAAGGPVGAVGGAAIGGVAGKALQNLARQAQGQPVQSTPMQALGDMALEGAKQGGVEAAGVGLVAGAKAAAPALMQSAVKPAYSLMSKAVKNAEVPRVVKTLLDEGINVTHGGIGKLTDLLGATNDEIKNIIANSKAVVFPESVAAKGEEVAAKLGNQVAGDADVAASQSVTDQFMRNHGGAPNLPAKPLTVQEAQSLKQGTYKALGQRSYGEAKGATTETEKALARGLKEGIEAAHPEVKAMNAREGALMEARDAIAKRVALAANRDPGGLGWITANPKEFVAFVLARSPAAKSMLARGLYQSAAHASKIPENLIRLGVTALASSASEDSQ